MTLRLGILISGRGSNMVALAQACAAPDFPADVAVVISNRPDARGLVTAREMGLKAVLIDHKDFDDRSAFEAGLENALKDAGANFICSAGFMRILTDDFVRAWEGRMLNTHPSLLPAFKGIDVHKRVLAAGVRVSGATIHFVTPELDSGPIVGQAAVPVLPDDTPATLEARVLEAEHQLYPACLRLIATGQAKLIGNRVVFAEGLNTASGCVFSPAVHQT